MISVVVFTLPSSKKIYIANIDKKLPLICYLDSNLLLNPSFRREFESETTDQLEFKIENEKVDIFEPIKLYKPNRRSIVRYYDFSVMLNESRKKEVDCCNGSSIVNLSEMLKK